MEIVYMESGDIEGVLRVQSEVFAPHLHESEEVFRERLQLFPIGCWVAKQSGEIAGYLISYPWRLNHAPALDTLLQRLPKHPDCYYIHDIATNRPLHGYGRALAERALNVAAIHGFTDLALISVQGSKPLCERLGFRVSHALSRDQLANWGEDAAYMHYSLAPS